MCAAQLGLHPIFQRLQSLRNNRVFNKGREMAEDMRERWETSDSAMVHRIQVHPVALLFASSSVLLFAGCA